MYLSVPPYGSSLFNGAPIPPYDGPFSGGSAYHYNYGSRLSAGSPYRPLHLSGPPPYSGGSMMGTGICFSSCSIMLVDLKFSFFGERWNEFLVVTYFLKHVLKIVHFSKCWNTYLCIYKMQGFFKLKLLKIKYVIASCLDLKASVEKWMFAFENINVKDIFILAISHICRVFQFSSNACRFSRRDVWYAPTGGPLWLGSAHWPCSNGKEKKIAFIDWFYIHDLICKLHRDILVWVTVEIVWIKFHRPLICFALVCLIYVWRTWIYLMFKCFEESWFSISSHSFYSFMLEEVKTG